MFRALRIAAVSTGPADADLPAALQKAATGIAHAAQQGAQLIVLPELFALPYTAGEDPRHWPVAAETLDGPTIRWARGEAFRHGVDIVFGMALETEGKPLNAALLVRADGSVTPIAAKHHLPPPGPQDRFGEADHFQRGDGGLETFTLGEVRIAVLICYERRLPDRWRATTDAGADLVLVLVAGPAPQDPDGFYLSELSGHAAAHGLHVLAAARTGTEMLLGKPVRHDGINAAIGPSGAVHARGSGEPGDVLLLDLDVQEIAARRASRRGSALTLQTENLVS